MESRELTPSDFQQLLYFLTPKVAEIVEVAEGQGYKPPFEVLATDVDDHVVFQFEVNGHGTVQNFIPDLDAPLKGRAPLAIVLTDQAGNVWTWNFQRPTRSCIQ